MKINKSIIFSFVLLVLIASLYRVMPGRPWGFAPQIAMGLFSGSILRGKASAFAMPLFSMLISDLIYQGLYMMNLTPIAGFYDGQWINYLLFMAITLIGFAVNPSRLMQIAGGCIGGTVFYFLSSNFAVWIGGGLDVNNMPYPKTLNGLSSCYVAGLPFLITSFIATLVFSTILFGGYYLINRSLKMAVRTA